MNSLLRQTATIIAKDLRREWRTREVLTTTIAFAVLLMVIFAFAFYQDEQTVALVFPGTLWVAIVFTGTLAIARTFQHEATGDCLRALALIPGSERSLYLGKFVVNLFFMIVFELALIPLLLFTFSVDVSSIAWPLVATVLAGTVGFSALGTVVAAMLVRSELREVLLPIVLYPLLVPLLIIGVQVTSALLEGSTFADVAPWVQAMVAMDLLYLMLGFFLFHWVLSAVE
jgi:heme exporter protein B